MSTFDYRFLLEQLSDRGFEHCKSLLFPMLGYRYIAESDIRKIDLCERLYDLTSNNPMKLGQKKDMSCEAYYEIIESHLQSTFACKSGSIAEDYKNRALQTIRELRAEKSNDEKAVFDKRLTLFAIFLSLLRASFPDFQKAIASDAQLFAIAEDANALKAFREYRKKGLPDILKRPDAQPNKSTDIVYMHNIIMYCILMEIQGEYAKEDSHERTD